MKADKSKKVLLIIACAYWCLSILIYAVAHDQFHYQAVTNDVLIPFASTSEIIDGFELRQNILISADRIESVEVMVNTYGRENSGYLCFDLLYENETKATEGRIDVSTLINGSYNRVPFEKAVDCSNQNLMLLVIRSEGCSNGNAVSVYFGNTQTVGRFDIVQAISKEELFSINGVLGQGKLCIKLNGIQFLKLYFLYWPLVVAFFGIALLYILHCIKRANEGENNIVVLICLIYEKYGFLIRQLISRDFKAKYKRSVLGMTWSFLNPLLSMSVQYVVFSTLFRSSTVNYPVYLLSGIVFFNFFNEAVSMGMTSITGNASLIKKVYMPKYIFPIARVFSSLINFGFSILPLSLVMLLTGTRFTPSLALLVFDILCLLLFVMGMVMLLSTSMTFFQDTQFLWSVVSMMWVYMTPIFYSESIIPQKLLVFYHMNPMYQYITFARICIIEGVSPAPTSYLWCMISAGSIFVIGALTFKKYQDKFVLYL